MYKLLLSCLFFGSAFLLKAQDVIKATILDQNNKPISYVNIGVLNTAIGTVSQENGQFELVVDQVKATDTIKISTIGFSSRAFVLQNLRSMLEQNPQIVLNAIQYDLAEVTIKPLSFEEFGFDKTSMDRNTNFAISKYPRQNLGAEIARKFKMSKYTKRSKSKACRLDALKFYLGYCDYDWAKLRVMVYHLENGQPGTPLLNENVIAEVKKGQTGWVEVNLKPFDLIVDEDIAIGLEWIDHSPAGRRLSLPIAFPAVGSTHFYQFGSQNAWKKFPNMSTPMVIKVAY